MVSFYLADIFEETRQELRDTFFWYVTRVAWRSTPFVRCNAQGVLPPGGLVCCEDQAEDINRVRNCYFRRRR